MTIGSGQSAPAHNEGATMQTKVANLKPGDRIKAGTQVLTVEAVDNFGLVIVDFTDKTSTRPLGQSTLVNLIEGPPA